MGFSASVHQNGNYLKMFLVDCPAVFINETWQVNGDSVPSKRLPGPNVQCREPIDLKANCGRAIRKTAMERCLLIPQIDQVLNRAITIFCLLKEDRSIQVATVLGGGFKP